MLSTELQNTWDILDLNVDFVVRFGFFSESTVQPDCRYIFERDLDV
jgi:hypothetical protein